MKTISTISEVRSAVQSIRSKHKSVGFVPTMGYLHEGHLHLIRKAKKVCDSVVVSIFVNPTQFAPGEDFAKYPRDIERDTALAKAAGADVLFVPSVEEMYPKDFSAFVIVEGLSSVLEGVFRPSHFDGVTTIVNKLFNIVQADKVFFGQKDAQQCAVVKKMVKDLQMPVEIEIVPTVREVDGLAMSSRNIYLNADERKNASVLYQALQYADEKIKEGEKDVPKIVAAMKRMIQSKNPSAIDYIAIVDSETLQPKNKLAKGDSLLIPLAVRFGTTRLIDNITVRL
ncbi:MAG: pantoate--beta-alanine ligase [Bacteroidota bacterium]|nr:pantoate--beta-alanine ligase [Bacteroidota bacterium]